MKAAKMLLLAAVLMLALAASAFAGTVTLWDFQTPDNGTSSSDTFGDYSTQMGTGTFSLTGGATEASTGAFASDFGSSDPRASYGFAYNITSCAALNSGIQFNVSTLGYNNISLGWDWRRSGTAATSWKVEYFDGSNWLLGGTYSFTAGSTWANNNTCNLSGFQNANNNNDFAFRIVSDGTSGASTGTLRLDMVKVTGDANSPVPEPGSLLALSSGLIGLVGVVARKRLA